MHIKGGMVATPPLMWGDPGKDPQAFAIFWILGEFYLEPHNHRLQGWHSLPPLYRKNIGARKDSTISPRWRVGTWVPSLRFPPFWVTWGQTQLHSVEHLRLEAKAEGGRE